VRPKKVVLYVSPDEQRQSIQKFLLETKGLRVYQAANGQDALAMLEEMMPGSVDVLVAECETEAWGNEFATQVKDMAPVLPVLLLSHEMVGWDHHLKADVFLPKGCHGPAELVERIRVLAARKRGPKKKLPRPRPDETPCKHARAFEEREAAQWA